MTDTYDDIINLPCHVSKKRPQMSLYNRAAQFSPFSALSGHDAAIKETARLTNERIELDEYAQGLLNRKLQILMDSVSEHPEISVTFFKADAHKSGGEYRIITGQVKKVDQFRCMFVMMNDEEIPLGDIYDVTGELFKWLL